MTEFIVMTSAGRVKGRARQYAGKYRNVAVVEVEYGARPFKIDARLSTVHRIVKHWGACCTGKTARCQYARALAEATNLAEELNYEAEAAWIRGETAQ